MAGIALVARAAGVSRVTVTAGVDELDGGAEPLGGRARRPGGGRKRAADLYRRGPARRSWTRWWSRKRAAIR